MTRVVGFLLRNWPLKVAAILLATLLYGGLVLAQNTRTWQGRIPIGLVRPPAGAVVLEPLAPELTNLRYRAPVDVASRLTVDDFQATVDLSGLAPQPGGPPESVRVGVRPVDSRVEIVDYEPKTLAVRLDPVITRTLGITVERGEPPAGLVIGPATVEPATVALRGASSAVLRVRQVVARVTIDASGLNVDTEGDLSPVDERGDVVPRVEVTPERARVRIQVARQLATRPVPLVPQIVGQPAPGYRVAGLTVDPIAVTVSGEEQVVGPLQSVSTAPVDIAGRTEDLQVPVSMALPPEVTVIGADRVTVSVDIVSDAGTQTFRTGVVLEGARGDRSYVLSVGEVQVTLGGPVAALRAVDPTKLVARAAVGSARPGERDVEVSVVPPPGTTLVAVSPARVRVSVAAASPAPVSPAASPAVSPPPGG